MNDQMMRVISSPSISTTGLTASIRLPVASINEKKKNRLAGFFVYLLNSLDKHFYFSRKKPHTRTPAKFIYEEIDRNGFLAKPCYR